MRDRMKKIIHTLSPLAPSLYHRELEEIEASLERGIPRFLLGQKVEFSEGDPARTVVGVVKEVAISGGGITYRLDNRVYRVFAEQELT